MGELSRQPFHQRLERAQQIALLGKSQATVSVAASLASILLASALLLGLGLFSRDRRTPEGQ